MRRMQQRMVGGEGRLLLQNIQACAGQVSAGQGICSAWLSTTAPRAQLMRRAVGFIFRSAASSIRWRVCSVYGTWSETMSLSRSRVSRSVNSTWGACFWVRL